MISVGEATGALDTMLDKIADFYDDEVDDAVAAMTSMMEPLLMVFLGTTVGGAGHRHVPAHLQAGRRGRRLTGCSTGKGSAGSSCCGWSSSPGFLASSLVFDLHTQEAMAEGALTVLARLVLATYLFSLVSFAGAQVHGGRPAPSPTPRSSGT